LLLGRGQQLIVAGRACAPRFPTERVCL